MAMSAGGVRRPKSPRWATARAGDLTTWEFRVKLTVEVRRRVAFVRFSAFFPGHPRLQTETANRSRGRDAKPWSSATSLPGFRSLQPCPRRLRCRPASRHSRCLFFAHNHGRAAICVPRAVPCLSGTPRDARPFRFCPASISRTSRWISSRSMPFRPQRTPGRTPLRACAPTLSPRAVVSVCRAETSRRALRRR